MVKMLKKIALNGKTEIYVTLHACMTFILSFVAFSIVHMLFNEYALFCHHKSWLQIEIILKDT
jgi:hypothetical protein